MKEKEDFVQRVNIDRIFFEEGIWVDNGEVDIIESGMLILQMAIFESVFSYIDMATEDTLDVQAEMTVQKVVNAMLKKTEIEVVTSLISAYNKRLLINGGE